jgi:para-aminobenzoate synthetase component 1
MRTRSVLFRDDLAGSERLFQAPRDVIVADDPAGFEAALAAAETARRAGKWLAGYVSYEAGYLLDRSLVAHMPPDRRVPLVNFGVFDAPEDGDARAVPPASNGPLHDAQAGWSFEDYRPRFERLHRHLREGDCYQANLTFPVRAGWSGDPRDAFAALIRQQPVRYGALVDLGGPVVCSRSPELFFDIDTDGWIEAHPMKGTIRRGATPAEDERLKAELREDEKSQAENRMIVDLLRNDISRISEVGTLNVPALFAVETYPTVHQLVSKVRARLVSDLTVRDLFAALFPCGSVTGAPKIRAMQILRALEGQARDVYCGAIGWIAPDGRMRFSVAIRTITLYPDGTAVYNVGGGIVFDSTARAEYEECLLKARFATGEIPATT